MRRNHRNAVLAACTAVAKGVAMVQLSNGGFDIVSFDPRTL
jgi:hypothetical protein